MAPEIPRRRPPTRADVARLAGVSPPVVSYTLNGGPKRVSDETRARVEEAVRTLGYRPNASARALRLGSTGVLGLVVHDLSNPFFARLSYQVELQAQEHGYALIIVNAGLRRDPAAAIDDLAARQVDGIVVELRPDASGFAALDRANVPFVLLDQHEPLGGAIAIGADLYRGARGAVEHLLGHGHRRIGFVGEPADRRHDAWKDALAAGGATGPAVPAAYSMEGGYLAMRAILDSDAERPTAIFASSDQQAVGALRAAHEAGLDIPTDLAFAAFDGTSLAEYCWPPLTTVEQPTDEMARRAIAAIGDPGSADAFTQLPGRLIIRASCGCPV